MSCCVSVLIRIIVTQHIQLPNPLWQSLSARCSMVYVTCYHIFKAHNSSEWQTKLNFWLDMCSSDTISHFSMHMAIHKMEDCDQQTKSMSQKRNSFVPLSEYSKSLDLSIAKKWYHNSKWVSSPVTRNNNHQCHFIIYSTALIFVADIIHALWSILLSIDPEFTTARQTFFSFLYNSFIRNNILCNIYQEENTELFTMITLYSLIRAATATH